MLLDATQDKTTIQSHRAGGRRDIVGSLKERSAVTLIRAARELRGFASVAAAAAARIYTTGSMTFRPLNDRRQRTGHGTIRARRPAAVAAIILTNVHDPRRQGGMVRTGRQSHDTRPDKDGKGIVAIIIMIIITSTSSSYSKKQWSLQRRCRAKTTRK